MEVDSDLGTYTRHLNLNEDFEGTLWRPTEDACGGLDSCDIWF